MDEDASKAAEDVKLVKQGFPGFLRLLMDLLDGRIDAGEYDDSCRAMVGSMGFRLSTMDKVIGQIVRALQQLVHDKAYPKIFELYKWEQAAGVAPKRYILHAKQMLEARWLMIWKCLLQRGNVEHTLEELCRSGASDRFR